MILLTKDNVILKIYEQDYSEEYPLLKILSDQAGVEGSQIRYYHLVPNDLLPGDAVPALSLSKNIEFFASFVWDMAIKKEEHNMTGSGPSVILLGTMQSNLKAIAVNSWVQQLYAVAGQREDAIKAAQSLEDLDGIQLHYLDYPDKPYKIREIAIELGMGL